DAIRGRISRASIVNPITDELIVGEAELITIDKANKIEELGLEKIQVRSPMSCEAELGMCKKCYGMDLSTGSMVEEGLATGIIAAQSIGEPGTQLTMRTFHIGGVAQTEMEESELKCRKGGTIRYARIRSVVNSEGHNVVLTRNGEAVIMDAKHREIESYRIPNGSILMVDDGQKVEPNTVICQWDPHAVPILAEVGGRVRYDDIIEGRTITSEKDSSGNIRKTIIEHKGEYHPQIILEDATGKILDFYYLPERATIEAEENQEISAGVVLAKLPRESGGTQDITGGLPRVTELFEARKPKDPAVLAEIDGEVELLTEKKRGKRILVVRAADGTEVEHVIPHGKALLVHTGDIVRAGDALVRGPLVPHDILRVSGEEAVHQYLLHEIQSVYRAQRVEIDDKHIEIVVSQMLRKLKVDDVGDTRLLPGSLVDKIEFRRANEHLLTCVKITEPGHTEYEVDDVVTQDSLDEVNALVEAEGGVAAEGTTPTPAVGSTQLLGITKAAVQSESFISAASFQETTKVLTESALAGKSDFLVGLKENVILGHLIPAGTGFHTHQQAEVRIRPEALQELQDEKDRMLAARMDLLNQLGGGNNPASTVAAPISVTAAPITVTATPITVTATPIATPAPTTEMTIEHSSSEPVSSEPVSPESMSSEPVSEPSEVAPAPTLDSVEEDVPASPLLDATPDIQSPEPEIHNSETDGEIGGDGSSDIVPDA
ncbi:MAG: hypothetical protein JKY95_18820, partial [Planctomycetaceae bacterium]|nr:hypothetical protein [Planctomycetaceae bacterium]